MKREMHSLLCQFVDVTLLGQSGCKLQIADTVIYVDPYLSNSVQKLDAIDLKRLIDIPIAPANVTDADVVLLTHEHIDHCDPHTIPELAQASPEAIFIGPKAVMRLLKGWGLSESRLIEASEQWLEVAPQINVRSTLAAHPEIELDEQGNSRYVGYLIRWGDRKIYLAGDTSARQDIIDALQPERPIHTAFLPVNEQNFFRERRGIVGNMSIREAFQFAQEIGVSEVVAVHWDMFAANSVEADEIKLVHEKLKPDFKLSLRPTRLHFESPAVSVVIRTLNEAQFLDRLLESVLSQTIDRRSIEVVVVDSGSTDGTIEIAREYACNLLHISKDDFSFGRSLNVGCEAARGDVIVIVSGHCVPSDSEWLANLVRPITSDQAEYVYGRQLSGPESQFSEGQIFSKYFPERIDVAQGGYFCNNANSAIKKTTWQKLKFDEDLTGLEDMELAQRLTAQGGYVMYVPEAKVFHLHDESWAQVQRRFEREAVALQKIMPHMHLNRLDVIRFYTAAVARDFMAAASQGQLLRSFVGICRYRWHQFYGSYLGNHQQRLVSRNDKQRYFYPAPPSKQP